MVLGQSVEQSAVKLTGKSDSSFFFFGSSQNGSNLAADDDDQLKVGKKK